MSPLAHITVEFNNGLVVKIPITEEILRENPAAPIILALEARDAQEAA